MQSIRHDYVPSIAIANETTVVFDIEIIFQDGSAFQMLGNETDGFAVSHPIERIHTNFTLQYRHETFGKVLGFGIGNRVMRRIFGTRG